MYNLSPSLKMKTVEAIILAGGLGTRLQDVVYDMPKPMAAINGKPFLSYLLNELSLQGIESVILSVGYKYKMIEAYFGHRYAGMELKYAIEPEPLGTGGGIKLAMNQVNGQRVFLFNGDTLFKVPLSEMETFHLSRKHDLTLAVKEMTDFDRYGRVEIDNGEVQAFHEKQKVKKGFINGGVYLMEKNILLKGSYPAKFSFEKDFLEKQIGKVSCGAFAANGYFLDIGIPETYEQAQNDFRRLNSGE